MPSHIIPELREGKDLSTFALQAPFDIVLAATMDYCDLQLTKPLFSVWETKVPGALAVCKFQHEILGYLGSYHFSKSKQETTIFRIVPSPLPSVREVFEYQQKKGLIQELIMSHSLV
jgi:hypothetical protein